MFFSQKISLSFWDEASFYRRHSTSSFVAGEDFPFNQRHQLCSFKKTKKTFHIDLDFLTKP